MYIYTHIHTERKREKERERETERECVHRCMYEEFRYSLLRGRELSLSTTLDNG
jgi:hypothetical protein